MLVWRHNLYDSIVEVRPKGEIDIKGTNMVEPISINKIQKKAIPEGVVPAKVETEQFDSRANEINRMARNHIGSFAPGSASLKGRVTEGAPIVPTIAELESNVTSSYETLKDMEARLNSDNPPAPHTLNFPHLAWESVKAGLKAEGINNEKLNTHIKEAEKHQKDIDLLLDLSAELTGHKDDTKEMSQKMKDLLADLKTRGIDLWKGEGFQINTQKISDLKLLTNAQVEKLRSNLQISLTTKIQALIQSIGAILETIKEIIRNNTKLINTINRLPGH